MTSAYEQDWKRNESAFIPNEDEAAA